MKVSPLLIGIAGGSGAGKTWLSERIARAFSGKVARIALDDFYRDRSKVTASARTRVNYDHPRAIDWALLLRFLGEYRSGRTGMLPRYDFTTHCRENESRVCELKPILLVEGLWTLARRELRGIFDLTIYIECPEHLRLERRIARDTAERGRTARDVRAQFRRSVAPMHDVHVEPQKGWAQVVLGHPISEGRIQEVIGQLESRLEAGNRVPTNVIVPGAVHRWQEHRDWRDVA
jgi:uridine kinase